MNTARSLQMRERSHSLKNVCGQVSESLFHEIPANTAATYFVDVSKKY